MSTSPVAVIAAAVLLFLQLLIASVSSECAYPLGCSQQHPSYYDYEHSQFPPSGLPVKTVDDYLLTRRLGTGKFSDVFEAVDVEIERNLATTTKSTTEAASNEPQVPTVDPRTIVVLKCLKPVSGRKIRRELLVLQHASKLPNLARLLAITVPNEYYKANRLVTQLPRMPTLVLEHAGPGSQWLSHRGKGGLAGGGGAFSPFVEGSADDEVEEDLALSDYEIRYYLYHLLVALDALHSKGIMHRDVKPRNALIHRTRRSGQSLGKGRTILPLPRPLMLIDLGLADFYRPAQKYNVRVASRHYKSPELLLGYEYYDYSVDMWGVGCILAGLLWHREPFFRGKDNLDQLSRIITVLGTSDLIDYIVKYKMELKPDVRDLITKHVNFEQQQKEQQQEEQPADTPMVPLSHKERFWLNFQASASTGGGKADSLATCTPSSQGLDLLNKLLVYDHDERLTAQQAMQHSFFDVVRSRVNAEVRSYQRSVPILNAEEQEHDSATCSMRNEK